MQTAIHRDMFGREYATIYQGNEQWQQVEAPASATYAWEPDSTYIREPPFFAHLSPEPEPLQDISGARVLVSLGELLTRAEARLQDDNMRLAELQEKTA